LPGSLLRVSVADIDVQLHGQAALATVLRQQKRSARIRGTIGLSTT
jgi:hypothetical protein